MCNSNFESVFAANKILQYSSQNGVARRRNPHGSDVRTVFRKQDVRFGLAVYHVTDESQNSSLQNVIAHSRVRNVSYSFCERRRRRLTTLSSELQQEHDRLNLFIGRRQCDHIGLLLNDLGYKFCYKCAPESLLLIWLFEKMPLLKLKLVCLFTRNF